MTYENVRLNVSVEVRSLLDSGQILDDDIRQVIQFAEESGLKFVNKGTGRFLAGHKIGEMTFWVEYAPADDEFIIHNAYSHRMEIVEEDKGLEGKDGASPQLDWLCAKCQLPLGTGKVKVGYLGTIVRVDLSRCAGCGQVFIPEDLALGKMAEVEQLLEDK